MSPTDLRLKHLQHVARGGGCRVDMKTHHRVWERHIVSLLIENACTSHGIDRVCARDEQVSLSHTSSPDFVSGLDILQPTAGVSVVSQRRKGKYVSTSC